MSMFQTNVGAVDKEAKFYTETDNVMQDIADFRNRLSAQNEEFNLLLEYYVKHRGKIDVHHQNSAGQANTKPNLGTADESWYYLDAKGNKIWVKSMDLDTSDPKCGAFVNQKNTDGRVVVVTVPKNKRNYALQPDYHKKCVEYDAYMESMHFERSRRAAQDRHTKAYHDAFVTYQHVQQMQEQQQQQQHQNQNVSAVAGTHEDVERYIASQKNFNQSLQHVVAGRGAYNTNNTNDVAEQQVFRPPASIEEAEMRLAELRQQEAIIRESFAVERN